ncbi:MAG: flagellar biosynthetic protein FliO [Lachnospiraceae bacterium]|jgi:flagellar protein FliO/FliZ|nr:flagellar biosynthetic protein FliO [Lachnospiraceae bacterium]
MLLTQGSGVESFVQFMTVLVLFCVVLGITWATTRYVAGFQKLRQTSGNISVLETCRVAPNKYVQIIKLGKTYVAVAICKDTMTKLAELSGEDLEFSGKSEDGIPSFIEVLEKAKLIKQKK